MPRRALAGVRGKAPPLGWLVLRVVAVKSEFGMRCWPRPRMGVGGGFRAGVEAFAVADAVFFVRVNQVLVRLWALPRLRFDRSLFW